MEPKLIRLVELIFEGVDENYEEVKKELEERDINPDKLTEAILEKIAKLKNEKRIATNKKILEEFRLQNSSASGDYNFKAAANFRKKENITAEDIESIKDDEGRLKIIEQLKENYERSGKGSSEKDS
mgnify:CR=1 FL=1